jgi:hypothetical protein
LEFLEALCLYDPRFERALSRCVCASLSNELGVIDLIAEPLPHKRPDADKLDEADQAVGPDSQQAGV